MKSSDFRDSAEASLAKGRLSVLAVPLKHENLLRVATVEQRVTINGRGLRHDYIHSTAWPYIDRQNYCNGVIIWKMATAHI